MYHLSFYAGTDTVQSMVKNAKKSADIKSIVPLKKIDISIILLRGFKVMLDKDLAIMYDIETRKLRQQIKRNIERFPSDFMFQISPEEANFLVSQNVIPNINSLGGTMPYAFTQEGVAMLSGVLRTKRAIAVNIEIMRAFVRLRRLLDANKDLSEKIDLLELRYDEQFTMVFEMLKKLTMPPDAHENRKIGFKVPDT